MQTSRPQVGGEPLHTYISYNYRNVYDRAQRKN